MENVVYLSLGSNIGDRAQYLSDAVEVLNNDVNVAITKISSIYETEPVGYEQQDQFLNMAVEIRTNYKPLKLLETTQQIEQNLGRKRDLRWGPRTIDLDILTYNKENIEMEQLTIPHPRISERAFVVVPLMELNSSIYLPNVNKTIGEIYNQLQGKEGVRVWRKQSWAGEFELFES